MKREMWQKPRTVFILIIVIGLAVFYNNVQYSGRAVDMLQSASGATERKVLEDILQQPPSASAPSFPSPSAESATAGGQRGKITAAGLASKLCTNIPSGSMCNEEGSSVTIACSWGEQITGAESCKEPIVTAAQSQWCTTVQQLAEAECRKAAKECDEGTYLVPGKTAQEPPTERGCFARYTPASPSYGSCTELNKGVEIFCESSCTVICAPEKEPQKVFG